MPSRSRKNKIVSIITAMLVISTFFFNTKILTAQSLLPFPWTPVGSPTGIPTAPAHFVADIAVQSNTSLLVTNTYTIASLLSGLQPSYEQQDTLMVRIGKLALKQVLRQVTNNIVAWIDSGFDEDKNPAFITNTEEFLLDVADKTVGDFILRDPALNFLCDPFKIQVKLALGFQYRPFKEKIECSFSEIAGNIDGAYNDFVNGDFIAGGGWNSWLKLTTEPQNNQMGAMIIAQGELDARLQGSTHQAELEANWGQGFLSWKECPTPNYVAAPGQPGYQPPTATRDASTLIDYRSSSKGCKIKTPGGVIASKINWVDSTTIRQLEIADDIDAIFNALFNQVLHFGMESMADNGLLGSGNKKPDDSYDEYMTYLEEQRALLEAQSRPTPANTGNFNNSGNNSGSINYASSEYYEKANALALIDSLLATQNEFLAAQSEISVLLNNTQTLFAGAVCSQTNKDLIQSEIINQINGSVTYTKTLPNLVWNKTDVGLTTTVATNNVNTLNSKKTTVDNASTEAQVSQTVQSLSAVQLYSPAYTDSFEDGGQNRTDIENWIKIKQAEMSSLGCTVDISSLGISELE